MLAKRKTPPASLTTSKAPGVVTNPFASGPGVVAKAPLSFSSGAVGQPRPSPFADQPSTGGAKAQFPFRDIRLAQADAQGDTPMPPADIFGDASDEPGVYSY